MRKKKLLVIGGSGFIGHHILKKAIKLGWAASSISRKKPSVIRKIKKVKYFKGNLDKFYNEKKKIFKDFDYVINLANSKKFEKKKEIKKFINFLKTVNTKKFIQIGSSAEYGNLPNKKIFESIKCKPISKYGKQKLAHTKNFISGFKENNYPLVILRLFQVYGPRDNRKKIIPFILNNCSNNNQFNITDGNQTRDFCYIDDVVRAIMLILKDKSKNLYGKIYNIGSENQLRLNIL